MTNNRVATNADWKVIAEKNFRQKPKKQRRTIRQIENINFLAKAYIALYGNA